MHVFVYSRFGQRGIEGEKNAIQVRRIPKTGRINAQKKKLNIGWGTRSFEDPPSRYHHDTIQYFLSRSSSPVSLHRGI